MITLKKMFWKCVQTLLDSRGKKNQNYIKNEIKTRMFAIHMLNETRTLGDFINVLMLIKVVWDIYALGNKDCNKGLRKNHI